MAKYKLGIEQLEDRRLLTNSLSPLEQLSLELINRARANPTAEAARYGVALNAGLPAGTISTAAKGPLAPNQILNDVAVSHSADMLSRQFFAHNSSAGTPTQRAQKAGYPNAIGENIAYQGSSAAINPVDLVHNIHQELFKSASHRANMMLPSFDEVGIGVRQGVFNGKNTVMVTEDFGANPYSHYITGVAFLDNLVSDDFYSVKWTNGKLASEGVANLLVSATEVKSGAVYQTNTGASGGYRLPVPDGTYFVTVSGAGFPTSMVTNVVVSGQSVKVDFGDRPLGSIVGTLFNDINGNGSQGTNEPMLAGSTLYIDLDRNGIRDPGEPRAITSAAGRFTFEGLAAGVSYTIRVDAENGRWRQTVAANSAPVALATGQTVVLNLGAIRLGQIYGAVYDDQNANGQQEGISTTIEDAINSRLPKAPYYGVGVVYSDVAGLSISLYDVIRRPFDGRPVYNDTVLNGWTVYIDANNNGLRDSGERTAVTDASGVYMFDGLDTGKSYSVKVDRKPGWRSTTSGDKTVSLTTAAFDSRVYFGVYLPATISGLIFHDFNRDGSRSTNDSGLAGWQVFLDVNRNGIKDQQEPSATTDSNGAYKLEGLSARYLKYLQELARWKANPGITFVLAGSAQTQHPWTPQTWIDSEDLKLVAIKPAGWEQISPVESRAIVIRKDEFRDGASLTGRNFAMRDQSGRLALTGSAGNDTFIFRAGETPTVEWNGVKYTFNSSTLNITVDGQGGNDRVELHGSAGKDTAFLYPSSSRLAGANYSISTTNTEVHQIYSGGGIEDRAFFYDTPGDDTLYVRGHLKEARMTGPGMNNFASGFSVNYATASSGSDVAYMYDTASDDQFVFRGHRRDAYMNGGGLSNVVSGFGRIFAYSLAGGNDSSSFFDTSGDDQFSSSARNRDAIFTGGGLYGYAFGFARNLVQSLSGGNDQAVLRDSQFDDKFDGQKSVARLSGAGLVTEVHRFKKVSLMGLNGGVNRKDHSALDYVFETTGSWIG